jgi:hypothetical protein
MIFSNPKMGCLVQIPSVHVGACALSPDFPQGGQGGAGIGEVCGDTMCEVEVKLVEDCGTNFFDPSEFRWTRGETFMSSYEALAAAEVCAEGLGLDVHSGGKKR